MKNQKKPNLTKKTDFSYIYILMLISCPTLIVAIVLAGITIFNFANSINESKKGALRALSDSSTACEDSLNAAITMSSFFANNNIVASALTDTNWQYQNEIAVLLSDFKSSVSYVDSAYVYNYTNGTVYSENGLFSDHVFFSDKLKYDNYPEHYWRHLKFYRSEPYRILSPSLLQVQGNDEPKSIIPIVIRKVGNLQQKNYLILNVDIKKLLHLPSSNVVEVLIYNKFTNEIFYPDNYSAKKEMSDDSFLKQLSANPNGIFKFNFGKEKTIISTYSENDSVVGYTYFAVISLNKLIKHELPIIGVCVAIILTVLALSFYTMFYNAKKIYTPVKHTKDTLNKIIHLQDNEGKNIFEQIVSLSENIQNTNNNMLSFAQEHYLVNMLNSTEYYLDKKTIDALISSFDFKYKLFAVVLIQLAPTSKFYDLYGQEVYFNIKQDFYEIIKNLFSQHFITYILPAENGVLDIILNFENESDHSMIPSVFNDIYSLIQTDREYLNFSVGLGSICSDIKTIKTSHDVAKYNFIMYEQPDIAIKISPSKQQKILFNRSTEDALYAALSTYDQNKILNAVSAIFENNNSLSGHSVKLLYNYILNVILKFIRTKNINYKNDMLDYDILDSILKQPVKTIESDLQSLIGIIADSKKEKNKIEEVSNNIMDYVLKNFSSPNISIKEVSSKFYMSQSSVSRIIKNESGLGFRDFVNMKRIEKAKKLLTNKEKSLEKIYTECGFTNRQTFIRIFKTSVGQTPTEYAKTHEHLRN